MRVIFLTMSSISGVAEQGIYTDLMRKFRDEGHRVTIVCPMERRMGQSTALPDVDGVRILGVRTLNLQKANIVEKGVGQLLVERQFKNAIRKYLPSEQFDLILYSTPPITLTGVVNFIKNKNPHAVSYLLLKDIFPQNAVDLGMFGVCSIFYRYFRAKEIELYKQSDYIGCMSPANVAYVLEHNAYIDASRVEVAPNSVELSDVDAIRPSTSRNEIRQKYHLPTDSPIFIYGGNLGRPQGVPFLIQCLEANANRADCHFVVVGDGTEYPQLEAWHKATMPKNVSVFKRLPSEDYDALVRASDVGLIFLDYRFTIPNYPSRLLSYLKEKKPIIAATDSVCDMGQLAEANGYGLYCPSNDVSAFTRCVDRMLSSDLMQMGERGYRFFIDNYTVDKTYEAIVKHYNL